MSNFSSTNNSSDFKSEKVNSFENNFDDLLEFVKDTKNEEDNHLNNKDNQQVKNDEDFLFIENNGFQDKIVLTQDLFSNNFLNETLVNSNNPFSQKFIENPLEIEPNNVLSELNTFNSLQKTKTQNELLIQSESVNQNNLNNQNEIFNQSEPINQNNSSKNDIDSTSQNEFIKKNKPNKNIENKDEIKLNSNLTVFGEQKMKDNLISLSREDKNFSTILIQEQNDSFKSTSSNNVSNFNEIKKSINEKQLFLASCLLNDSCEGFPSECNYDSKSIYLYSIYRHFYLQFLLYILIFIHLCLAFFEEIGLSRENSKYDNLILTIEIICLIYYSIRLILKASMLPSCKFYSDVKNLLLIFIIFFTLIDMVIYITIPAKYAFRWSIILRPLFLINFLENKKIRRLIKNIRYTLPDVVNVLSLLLISISFFSLISIKLFKDIEFRSPNQIKAKTYLDHFYYFYVLFTTVNNPEMMMQAYQKNKFFSIFFIVFLIINFYIFTNIIVAVVYNNFKKNLKDDTKNIIRKRELSLKKSFEVMVKGNFINFEDTNLVFDDNESLNCEQFKLLMQTYFTCWKIPSSMFLHKKSLNDYNYLIQVYWKLLENNSKITWKEYENICDLIKLEIKVIDLNKYNQQNNSRMQKIYNTLLSKFIIKSVKSKYFRHFFDTIILLNSIYIAFDLDIYRKIELIFITLFVSEIFFKLFTFGFKNFFFKYWNIFDLVIISSSLIFLNLSFYYEKKIFYDYSELIIILRILRLSKWFLKIKRLSIIAKTILNLLPSIFLFSTLIILVLYSFSVIGMQLFRNLITPEIINNQCTVIKTVLNKTTLLTNTIQIKMNYCELNFNSFINSFFVLFNMIIVNEWNVIADNFEIASGSKFTRIFFVFLHLTCATVILNIFTAFVLEAFSLEYSNINDVIDDDENILKKKINQLDIECRTSVLDLFKLENQNVNNLNFDQLICEFDSDHDINDFSIKTNYNLESIPKNKYFVISLSPESQVKFFIKDNRDVEQFLFKLFKNRFNDL